MNPDAQAGKSFVGSLPLEPESRSELLSASHVFSVEIVNFTAEPWSGAEDVPQERRLRMQIRLLETFKGELTLSPGDTFPLEVIQRRQSKYVNWDYMGLWSHASPPPREGIRYLIVATGRSSAPASLMQEPSCERLFAGALAADATGAVEAERRYNAATERHSIDSNLVALNGARAVIQFARASPVPLDELFGRYLWARVRPAFIQSYSELLSDVLGLLDASDVSVGLRGELIAALDREVGYLDEPDELVRKVAHAHFRILLVPKAAPLFEQLVDRYIYNSVFVNGKPRLKFVEIVPSAEERARIVTVLPACESEESQMLATWMKVR